MANGSANTIGHLPVDVDGIDLPASRLLIAGRDRPGPFNTVDLHLGRRPTELSLARYRAIPEGGNRLSLPNELRSPCWRNHDSGSGDVMGRLRWTNRRSRSER